MLSDSMRRPEPTGGLSEKDQVRAIISNHIEHFLASGGDITPIDVGVTAEQDWTKMSHAEKKTKTFSFNTNRKP